jgi:hypothetical protein
VGHEKEFVFREARFHNIEPEFEIQIIPRLRRFRENAELFTHSVQGSGGGVCAQINPGVVTECIDDPDPSPRPVCREAAAPEGEGVAPVDALTQRLKQMFDSGLKTFERQMSLVEFEHGEFRVMFRGLRLIPEGGANLKDAFHSFGEQFFHGEFGRGRKKRLRQATIPPELNGLHVGFHAGTGYEQGCSSLEVASTPEEFPDQALDGKST